MTDMVERVGFAICSPAGNHCKRLCGECRRMSRAAIRALMEPTTDWQPIETAPISEVGKRPKYFLGTNGKHVGVAYREHNSELVGYEDYSEFGEPLNDLTHWMPLPEPPND